MPVAMLPRSITNDADLLVSATSTHKSLVPFGVRLFFGRERSIAHQKVAFRDIPSETSASEGFKSKAAILARGLAFGLL